MPSKPNPPKRTTCPVKRPANLSEIAFQRLQQAILLGELKEGERVRESRLAAEWELGVTPLREAMRRMAALGYLILQPNHAPVVRKLTRDDILEIYAIREVLECFALRRNWDTIRKSELERLGKLVRTAETDSTKNRRLQAHLVLDGELHHLWTSPEKGPWLASILERLLTYRPNLMKVLLAHPRFVDEAFEEHRQIIEALEKRDLDRALNRLRCHIKKSGTVLAALADRSPSRVNPSE